MNDTDATINGECTICGLPGTVGLHCSDPDCYGTVERIDDTKPKAQDDSERYDEGLVDGPEVLSLEEAAEAEERDEVAAPDEL